MLCYSVTAINILTRLLKMKWNRSVLNHCSAHTQATQQCNRPRSSGIMYSVVCIWIYDRVCQMVHISQEQNILQFFSKWRRLNAMGQQCGPWISKLWAIWVPKETANNITTKSLRTARKRNPADSVHYNDKSLRSYFFLQLNLLQALWMDWTGKPICNPMFSCTTSGKVRGRNRCALICSFLATYVTSLRSYFFLKHYLLLCAATLKYMTNSCGRHSQ